MSNSVRCQVDVCYGVVVCGSMRRAVNYNASWWHIVLYGVWRIAYGLGAKRNVVRCGGCCRLFANRGECCAVVSKSEEWPSL